ncbi:hypothetical protein [Streptomyces sp. SID13726]|uniref:hypothetical protein n=1 Tax=Streptomyces sp. SID13726 TaxID=2706058 RepID=UPI0013BE2933|nr:hypothetical protein [Streptomyces sp. SID13726]NEB00632.1 hypothetical protein [Streptomyces sp. SID13726]
MALPPSLWAELFFDGSWNDITPDVRQTAAVTVTRGQTSESSSSVPPTSSSLVLDDRSRRYAPRNPRSELYDKIGRNTPLRWGYREGSPWVQSDGTGTSVLTTPTQTAFNVTDLDVRLDIALESWEEHQGLASRFTASGDNRSWGIYLGGSGQLALAWSATGSSTIITRFSTDPVNAYNGQRIAIRVTLDVDNGASGYTLKFFTGRTVDDQEHEWTQLGDAITGGATTAVFAASSQIEFGDVSGLVLPCLTGKGYAMKLMTSIGGSTAMRMTTQDASPGVTSFTSNGLVWTVTGTGVSLSNQHVRMSGEVPEWPSTRDRSGNDTSVTVAPTDVTRRMDSGNKPSESSLLSFIRNNNPIECWPLTDGVRTDYAGGASLLSGARMTYRMDIGTAVPEWQGTTLAPWIEPVAAFQAETAGRLQGVVPVSTAADSAWSVDFFLSGGGEGANGVLEINDRGAGTDADNKIRIQILMDGSIDEITVFRALLGETSSSSTSLGSVSPTGIFNDNQPHHIRVSLDPGTTNTTYAIYLDGVSVLSGTMSAIVAKAVRDVSVNWALVSGGGINTADMGWGFITYWDGTGPSAAATYNAYLGFQGERAGSRVERLGSGKGITATVSGQIASQERMGIQTRGKTLALMSDAAKTDFGYVLGCRDRLEIMYRSHSTLWNQHPALTLDFSAGLLSDYKYRDDDLLTENDVTVTRDGGSFSRQVLEDGRLSVQDFPDGVGLYDVAYTYSLYADEQTAHTAYMLLHLGTFDGIRYTRITLDLANERVAQLLDDILRTDVGDLIRLTNLPQEQGADAVDSLVVGYQEEAGPTSWKINFICVPAEPWNGLLIEVARRDRLDTGGCQLNEALDETETGVDVLTTGLARWIDSATYAGDFPFDVITGGEVMRVTACTGTTATQTFTVTRAVNGVRKTHASGQPIALFAPVYFQL